jgi:prepilin-type N-terminal cleavage/methylation domain-containing protein
MRSNKGFTLVEMAIVLIIIGIILGAVVKGQDLITNARSKKLISVANTWNALAYTYMDRFGRFPGDSVRNGIIANDADEQVAGHSTIDEIAATMTNAPENPVMIGGQSYWIYFGNVTVTGGGKRNAMLICPSDNCSTALNSDSLAMMQALDTALDGSADAGVGRVRALNVAGAGYKNLDAATGNRANAVFDGTSAISGDADNTGSAVSGKFPWTTAYFGAVWVFDRPF